MKNIIRIILGLLFVISNGFGQVTQEFQTIDRSYETESLSAPDSLGVQFELKMPSMERGANQLLPYPIIFIHGLNSNSGTWNVTTNWMDQQYGLTYGGRMDVCLNYDDDNYSSNRNFYPTIDADLAPFTPTLIKGDYYYLNFDVGNNGSVFPTSSTTDYVLSDQSSVVKQALGLKYAIYKVLKETGRDKVVIMAHSMGGLAAREYLQNSYNWQSDGKTHVAKLVTTGTPHGGSNTSSFGTGFGGIDEKSEAVRDLRRTYYYSGDPGVYLFGGIELQDNDLHMDDNWNVSGYDFYTVDVNCNGNDGDNVVGLNSKNIFTNVEYACIIGKCSGCVIDGSLGDGIVNAYSANLNNFYNINADEFIYYGSAVTEIHTDLPEQNYENMQGLDVSPFFTTAYSIKFNEIYKEFITRQSANGISRDLDDFKFVKTGDGQFSFSIFDIRFNDFKVQIFDDAYNPIGSVYNSNGNSYMNKTRYLPNGNYYLEISASPTSNGYLYPYKFKIQETITSVQSFDNEVLKVVIYPNPIINRVTFEVSGMGNYYTMAIFDLVGQELYFTTVFEETVNMNLNFLPTGIYFVKITGENKKSQIKKVLVK